MESETYSETRTGLSWKGGAIPFWALHLAALGVFFVPFRATALGAFVLVYALGMFGITAGFHRYFAHRGFKTNRAVQFVLAWLGTMTSQKGVLWWSGHHRDHHRFSDTARDIHSPKKGFAWAHVFWFLTPTYNKTPKAQLQAFSKYPELVWLNRYWAVPPMVLAGTMYLVGGWSFFFWGYVLATVCLWHATFSINSLAHLWGRRRYATSDTSRNNLLLALLTFGEGWHNNHHFYPSTANNGFFWWEVDLSYYVLWGLSKVGWVSELRTPPAWVKAGRTAPLPELPPRLKAAMGGVWGLRERWDELDWGDPQFAKERELLGQALRHASEVGADVARQAADATVRLAEDARVRAAELRAELAEMAAREAHALSEFADSLVTSVSNAWSEALLEATQSAAEQAERWAELARTAVAPVPGPVPVAG